MIRYGVKVRYTEEGTGTREVILAERVHITDSGVLCFIMNKETLVKAFAPGRWFEVEKLD